MKSINYENLHLNATTTDNHQESVTVRYQQMSTYCKRHTCAVSEQDLLGLDGPVKTQNDATRVHGKYSSLIGFKM